MVGYPSQFFEPRGWWLGLRGCEEEAWPWVYGEIPSGRFPSSSALRSVLAGLVAGVTPLCSLEFVGRVAATDLRWESGAKERRRAGEAAGGNTGASREAERDCRVPLDLHRHSAVWDEEGRRCACFRVPDSAYTSVCA